jgi:hypothetical protein
MGNTFGRRKKITSATEESEVDDKSKPEGERKVSSEGSTASSVDDKSSKGVASEDESIDSSEEDEPLPKPPRKAWGGFLSGKPEEKRKEEIALKAQQEAMKLKALPPFQNTITGKLDGGCSTTMMSQKTYDGLIRCGADEQLAPMTSTSSIYKFANGQTKKANAHVAIDVEVNNHPCEIHANVFDDPQTHFLLGLNFMRRHKISISYTPEGDRITCEEMGLRNRLLPRDTAGLDVLPFFVDFPKNPEERLGGNMARRVLGNASRVYKD